MDIVKLWGENWEGLYVDGELEDQHHDVSVEDFLERLPGEDFPVTIKGFKQRSLTENEDERLVMKGSFPRFLKDV